MRYHYLDFRNSDKTRNPESFSLTKVTYRNVKRRDSSNENILPFITTDNWDNTNIYSTVESSLYYSKNNNVRGFHSIRVIQSKWQDLYLKKLETKEKVHQVHLNALIKDVTDVTMSW